MASLCVFGALCRVTVSQSTLERVASEAAAFRSLWLPLFSPCPLFIGRFFFAAKSLFFPSFLIALFSLCSELLHRGSFPVSRTTYLCSSWFRARVCKRPGMCGLHGLAEVWKHRFFRVRVPTFLFFFFSFLCSVSPLSTTFLFFHFTRRPFFFVVLHPLPHTAKSMILLQGTQYTPIVWIFFRRLFSV